MQISIRDSSHGSNITKLLFLLSFSKYMKHDWANLTLPTKAIMAFHHVQISIIASLIVLSWPFFRGVIW